MHNAVRCTCVAPAECSLHTTAVRGWCYEWVGSGLTACSERHTQVEVRSNCACLLSDPICVWQVLHAQQEIFMWLHSSWGFPHLHMYHQFVKERWGYQSYASLHHDVLAQGSHCMVSTPFTVLSNAGLGESSLNMTGQPWLCSCVDMNDDKTVGRFCYKCKLAQAPDSRRVLVLSWLMYCDNEICCNLWIVMILQ